jgi:CheY-like chemotaxis protein
MTPESHPKALDSTPESGRILVVEDNPTNRMVIGALLKKQGLVFDSVENGRAAFERVSQGQPYALVLMDCQMPVMDGYEATEAIRAWEAQAGQARHLPIVALTASAFEEDRQHCLASGMDDFLAKPVNVQALNIVLAKWLPGSAQGPA